MGLITLLRLCNTSYKPPNKENTLMDNYLDWICPVENHNQGSGDQSKQTLATALPECCFSRIIPIWICPTIYRKAPGCRRGVLGDFVAVRNSPHRGCDLTELNGLPTLKSPPSSGYHVPEMLRSLCWSAIRGKGVIKNLVISFYSNTEGTFLQINYQGILSIVNIFYKYKIGSSGWTSKNVIMNF